MLLRHMRFVILLNNMLLRHMRFVKVLLTSLTDQSVFETHAFESNVTF